MKIWTIQDKQRKQIEVQEGSVYKDGNKWKLVAPKGIDTFITKRAALEVKRIMMG